MPHFLEIPGTDKSEVQAMRLQRDTMPVLAILLFGLTTSPLLAQDESDEAAPTAAERFAELDQDGDGKLTREEVGEAQRRFFNRLIRVADADKDGALSREEFVGGLAEQPPRQPADRAFGDAGELLRRLDRNGDGKIARDEVPERLPEAMREHLNGVFEKAGKDELTIDELRQGLRRAGGGFQPDALFDRLDRNGDGKLALSEVPERAREFIVGIFQRAGKGEDGSLTKEEFVRATPQPAGGRPSGPPMFFAKLDQNRDGALSKDELAKAAELLGELDQNGDGRLEPGELFRPAAPPRRPQGDANPQRGNRVPRVIRDNDRNEDGKLSKEEAPERMRANFERIDRNSDGTVDADELRQAFARLRDRQQRD